MFYLVSKGMPDSPYESKAPYNTHEEARQQAAHDKATGQSVPLRIEDAHGKVVVKGEDL